MIRISGGRDARLSALREPGAAAGGAAAEIAHLARRASGSTRAAVRRIGLRIDAGISAFQIRLPARRRAAATFGRRVRCRGRNRRVVTARHGGRHPDREARDDTKHCRSTSKEAHTGEVPRPALEQTTIFRRRRIHGRQRPARQLRPGPQVVPHPPQLPVSTRVSTQSPLHGVSVAGQAHVPPSHVEPGEHETPQFPQFRGSDPRLTHAAAQLTSGEGQLVLHEAPEQTCPAPQVVAQSPQCAGSLMSAAQVAPHWTCPEGHPQEPFVQDWSAPQVMPQPPQFFGCTSVGMQEPAQALKPGAHSFEQTPSLQSAASAGQTLPHAPQLSGSVASSTHALPQKDVPGGHAHVPPLQAPPVAHVAPHAPQ